MNYAPELLIIGAAASVGVLHTIVPDYWVPITLIARQRGWSKPKRPTRRFRPAPDKAGAVLGIRRGNSGTARR